MRGGFTLLEIIIACTIFFMVGFAVLEMVTRGLVAARSLQQRQPDAGILAASLMLTNQLEEAFEEGDFEDYAPGLYDGYRWGRAITEVGSNGLFQVDFTVYNASSKKGPAETHMSILMYRPGSKAGTATKGGRL